MRRNTRVMLFRHEETEDGEEAEGLTLKLTAGGITKTYSVSGSAVMLPLK